VKFAATAPDEQSPCALHGLIALAVFALVTWFSVH